MPSTPSAPTGPLVHVDTVSKAYRVGDVDTPVLEGVSFDLGRGETTSLVGASGSGKSTLLGLLAGLLRPGGGTIAFDGQDLAAMEDSERAALRARRIGIVLQRGNLVPFLTAAENVELACSLAGVGGSARRARAAELLDAVGLAARARHRPVELSGGERQRVAIARALANRPRLVLADEPTGNLDDVSTELVVSLLESLPAEHGCTLVVVTHDVSIARRAQRCYRLELGRAHEELWLDPTGTWGSS